MDDLLDDLRRLRDTAESYGQGRTADAFARAIVEIIRLRARPGWREGVEAAADLMDATAVSARTVDAASAYRVGANLIRALKEPTP